MGYDLRLVCRELSRVVRDLLVVGIDPSRASDPEIAGESERDRVIELASQFSREDLLRAFDLLTRAEFDIKGAAQPRYHLEMVLLRWIYLRKLTPIEDLLAGVPSRTEHGPSARPAQRLAQSMPSMAAAAKAAVAAVQPAAAPGIAGPKALANPAPG